MGRYAELVATPSSSPGSWPPRTDAALDAAAKGGHLSETHALELKREVSAKEKVSQLGEDVRAMLYRDRRPRNTDP